MRPLTSFPTTEVPRATAPRRSRIGESRYRVALLAAAAALVAASPAAHAERADRTKPMSVTSSGGNPDVVDLKKHSAVFVGNVIITQGTLEIHADRVEVSEDSDGARLGTAFGTPDHPATFRQKRDGEDEYSEGDAARIEYDSAGNRVRFVGAAHLRMLKGTTVTDTASAPLITYDTATDTVKFEGGGTQGPPGRTTVVFTPKDVASAPARKPLELPAPASGTGK
jgi:lipopolysaccharide export system protein LptA